MDLAIAGNQGKPGLEQPRKRRAGGRLILPGGRLQAMATLWRSGRKHHAKKQPPARDPPTLAEKRRRAKGEARAQAAGTKAPSARNR